MTSETKEIINKIRQFIINNFPMARKKPILENDDLSDNALIDSLGIVNLVNFVEGEFGITFNDEEFLPENFRTISCLAHFVKTKQNSH